MPPSKAPIPPRILLLFMDLRSYSFAKLFRNKSNNISSNEEYGIFLVESSNNNITNNEINSNKNENSFNGREWKKSNNK